MATIGTIGSQRSAAQPFNPGPSPAAAQLDGLAQAVGNLSGAYAQKAESQMLAGEAQTNLDLQLRDRQDNLDKAKAMVDFSRLQGEWTRESAEIETKAAADGSDLEPLLQQGFDKKFGAFRDSLPEHLRNSMIPALEAYSQGEKTSAFGKRLGMQGKAYIGGLQELQTNMLDQIFTGEKSFQDFDQVLDEYFANSPLPQAETEALKKATRKSLQEQQALTVATDEYAAPTQSQGGTDAVLPSAAEKFMEVISGAESGGRYDVRYGGANGPQTFTDFSKHPNIPETITSGPHAGEKSTAAGRYQFIHGTWQYVAGKIGATDFSPANQKRGAWFLAQEDYNKRTGRDLLADLESNSPMILSMVRREMGGTWEGLAKMTDEQFIAKYGGASGKETPSSIMTDDSYDELSLIERSQIMQQAQKAAAEQRTAGLKAKADQNSALMQTMLQDITSGKMTEQLMETTALEQGLTYEQTEQLRSARNKHQEGQVALENFARAISNPAAVFGAEEQKGQDQLYAQEGQTQIAEMNSEYVGKAMFPVVDRTGQIPTQLVTDLENMSKSSDPKKAQFAYDTMNGLMGINPGLFAAKFGDKAMADMLTYQSLANYLPEAERIADIQRRNSPEFAAVRSQLSQAMQQEFALDPQSFMPAQIAERLGYEGTLDSQTAASITSHHQQLYERIYLQTGNHALSVENATKMLGTHWGVFQDRLMENPPDKTGMVPIGGNYNWMDLVVRKDHPQLADTPYRLSSDEQTEVEKRRSFGGQSYLVETEIIPGFWAPVPGADGKPLRSNFEEPELQEKLSVDVSLWARKDQANAGLLTTAASYAALDSDPTGIALGGFLLAVDREIAAQEPAVMGKTKKLYEYEGLTVATPDEVTSMLGKLGYDSIDDFIKDTPMLDYETLRIMLEGDR